MKSFQNFIIILTGVSTVLKLRVTLFQNNKVKTKKLKTDNLN